MGYKAANNAYTNLVGTLNAGALSFSVTVGTGSRFPSLTTGDWTFVTLQDATYKEIVKISSISGDTFTIESGGRGQEGTTDRAWSGTVIVECRPTAGLLEPVIAIASNDAITATAALTPAADKLAYFTGPSAASLATITGFGRSLVGAIDATTARSQLGAASAPPIPVEFRTSNTALTAADSGKTILAEGTWTQTFASVADLGAGWWIRYINTSNGTITLNPVGSEIIDGFSTIDIPQYDSAIIVANVSPYSSGTHFYTIGFPSLAVTEQVYTAATTIGTVPNYVIDTVPLLVGMTEYPASSRFNVTFHATSPAGSNTLKISTETSSKPLKQYDSTGSLVPAPIQINQVTDVINDGTNWIVMNPFPSSTDAPSGSIVQVVEATPVTDFLSTTAVIPQDDTIPQITEGSEIQTVSITPTDPANDLVIEGKCDYIINNSDNHSTLTLFVNGGANAVAASLGLWGDVSIYHRMTGGAGPFTITMRYGSGSGTTFVNGYGSRYLGGIMAVRLKVTEIVP